MRLLREDPMIECNTPQYTAFAVASILSAALYCLGVPLAAFAVTQRHHGSSPARRRLVHVLTRSYTPACYYMESIDLLRKFVLTGVIMIFFPQSMVQLWFGAVVSLAALLLHLKLQPFRDKFCGNVQAAVHLQLLFTCVSPATCQLHHPLTHHMPNIPMGRYVTAMLFFVEDDDADGLADDDTMGLFMILANSLA